MRRRSKRACLLAIAAVHPPTRVAPTRPPCQPYQSRSPRSSSSTPLHASHARATLLLLVLPFSLPLFRFPSSASPPAAAARDPGGRAGPPDDDEEEMGVKEEEEDEEELDDGYYMDPRSPAAAAVVSTPGGGGGRAGGTPNRRRAREEKERTKMRERQRRAITGRILAGLRQHGNYSLRARVDINEVIAALAREAGWVVLPDGTTFPSSSSSAAVAAQTEGTACLSELASPSSATAMLCKPKSMRLIILLDIHGC